MRKFRFHYDAGHGWLEVHINDLLDLQMSVGEFSTYSYRKGDWLYLEEDLDAGTFIKKFEAKFDYLSVHHIDDGYYSTIRDYDRIPAADVAEDVIYF